MDSAWLTKWILSLPGLIPFTRVGTMEEVQFSVQLKGSNLMVLEANSMILSCCWSQGIPSTKK